MIFRFSLKDNRSLRYVRGHLSWNACYLFQYTFGTKELFQS
jgi:hypothetical protein